MPAFRIWASSTTSSSRDGVRGSPFRGCEAPVRAGGTNFACCARAPNLATARRAQAHRARRGRTMTIPPKLERHEWCLHVGASAPRAVRTCSGQLANVPRLTLADSLAGGTLPRRPPFVAANPYQDRRGRFMVVRLRQLKLYRILAAPEPGLPKSPAEARRGVARASYRIDFSTPRSASRSCARDSADPLIRPCQAPPAFASRTRQPVRSDR